MCSHCPTLTPFTYSLPPQKGFPDHPAQRCHLPQCLCSTLERGFQAGRGWADSCCISSTHHSGLADTQLAKRTRRGSVTCPRHTDWGRGSQVSNTAHQIPDHLSRLNSDPNFPPIPVSYVYEVLLWAIPVLGVMVPGWTQGWVLTFRRTPRLAGETDNCHTASRLHGSPRRGRGGHLMQPGQGCPGRCLKGNDT